MRNIAACLLVLQVLLVLGGCSSRQEAKFNEQCKSLVPLAKLLPAETELNGVPRSALDCNGQTEVVAVYGKWRDKGQKYYAYSLRVLDPDSTYVAAFLNDPENMVGGEDQFAARLEQNRPGFLKQFIYCSERATHHKNRPPTMVRQVGGLEFCIYTDDRRNVALGNWCAIAIHKDLMLTVWVWEPETVEFEYADEVVDRIVPYIEHLRFDALN